MSLAINRLDLAPWGNFADRSLHFDGGPGVVELIDGPNAAGKSTIARAQIALLYGIPARTVDNHTHQYHDLAIGAELLIDDRTLQVTRRKANTGSLLAADGSVLRDDPIPAALGGITREVYASLFHVDNDTLVRGGEDLLQGKGEIGSSLFTAAAGISALHQHVAAFEDRAGDIFRPRASSSSLMRELAQLREREKQLSATLVRPGTHKRLVAELEALQRQAEQLATRIAELMREQAELERLVEVVPLIAQHQQLAARRDDLGQVPQLAADARERRCGAQATLASQRGVLARQRAEHDRLTTLRDGLQVNQELLARAGEIRDVVEQIPVIQKAGNDRRGLLVELGQARDDLAVAADAAGVAPDQLAQLRRADAARRHLDEVVEQGARLRERVDAALQQRRTSAERHAQAIDQPAPTAEPADLSVLEAAVRAARPRIGLDDHLTQARQLHQRRRRDAEQALAALRPAPADLHRLLTLPTVSRDLIGELQARAAQLREQQIQLDADRRQLAQRHAEHAGLVEQLRQHGHVTTPGVLRDAREHRDQTWRALRGTADAGAAPQAAVLDSYEASVVAADQHADDLAADAAGAELARQEAADASRLGVMDQEVKDRGQAIEDATAALATGWAQTWAITALDPIGLDRAHDWLSACNEARTATQTAADTEDAASVLSQQRDRAVAALTVPLTAAGIVAPDEATVGDLVELAEGLIEANTRLAAEATQRRGELDRAQADRDRAQRDLDEAERELQQWEQAWPGCLDATGLPEGTAPGQARELARIISEGLAAQRQIDQLQSRIDGIDRDRRQLADRLQELLAEVATDLAGRDAWQAAAVVKDRLADQGRRQAKHDELKERLSEADAVITIASQVCADAEGELEQMRLSGGCVAVEDLPAVEDRYQAAGELDRQILASAQQIEQRGRDTLQNLTERTADLDRDETTLRIDQLSEECEALEVQRTALHEQIGQAKMGITAAEEDDQAVDAAQQVQFSHARLVELAREHAVARLSAAVIRQAVDRYRDHNQHPLVTRANELFGRFTEGTYAELFVDADERGRGCLVARRNNGVIHTMEQMSKGTREQLFLALRIAAIERFVRQSGPVPVLFDDVFVESDDARCHQIFDALGELAQQTQVIVLTHHHHLVEIAGKALGSQLNVQELPAARVELRAAA